MRNGVTGPRISRRTFLKGVGIAAVLAGAFAGEAVRETYSFVVSRHGRAVAGLRSPVRVSFLTDLHLGPYLRRGSLDAWCEASNAAAPDLVVLGGDLVDRFYQGDLSELVQGLHRLEAPLGVVAVPGNHDRTRYPDLVPLSAALREAGVAFLVNEAVRVRDDLWLVGVDDFRKGHADPARAMASVEGGGARVMVSHNPDLLPLLPVSTAPSALPDLVLCGHTHGGQVKLPLVGPLVTSSAYGRRFAEGWVDAEMSAFVSRGLGVSLVPFRWNCAPEVVLLDLVPMPVAAGMQGSGARREETGSHAGLGGGVKSAQGEATSALHG